MNIQTKTMWGNFNSPQLHVGGFIWLIFVYLIMTMHIDQHISKDKKYINMSELVQLLICKGRHNKSGMFDTTTYSWSQRTATSTNEEKKTT